MGGVNLAATASPGPLAGLRVLDTTRLIAGPYCAMLLGDMGADVVKIEPPGRGEDGRRLGPPFVGAESAYFLAFNRNKRSLALDLKRPGGADVFLRLADGADILLENFRPGTLDRLGLGYEALRARNPRLIYCAVSGFGATGPLRDKAGLDLIMQGYGGLMSITGEPGRVPVKVGLPATDLGAAMLATYGVLAALVSRASSAMGQKVETSLLECSASWLSLFATSYFADGVVPSRLGSAHPVIAPYQAFRTATIDITLGATSEDHWLRLLRVLGREELAVDARFATNAARVAHRDELTAELEVALTREAGEEWLIKLEASGLPCGPINTIDRLFAEPQIAARDMVIEVEHASEGTIRMPGLPVKLSATPGSIRLAPPSLGQHTDEVLRELGYDNAGIATLRETGTIA